jgi:3-phosphoshikimate 1-carboxyvinyltransferase
MDSSQRDKEFVDVLKQMGADIMIEGDPSNATVYCRGDQLHGTEVSVAQIPDLVPVMASTMAYAKGASMITNAERLKIKESDRLKTVYDMLSKLGADITDGGCGLSLTGMPVLKGGQVMSHNDHRIAMAAAVASCGCTEPVTIIGAEAVRKSYPGFFEDFAALGGEVYEVK